MAAPTVESRGVYRARIRHILYVILVTRHVMFTARPPYCLQRHTLLLPGCHSNGCKQRHFAYSMHVTIYIFGLSAVLSYLQWFIAVELYRIQIPYQNFMYINRFFTPPP
jgi:hypothetical protein